MYAVGRVQRDIMRSSSNVGFVATGVVRGDKQLDAFTGGPDYNLRWNRNRFNLSGHVIGTHAPIDGQMRDGYGQLQNLNFNSKHANAFAHFDHFDKDFRNSDIGFLASRNNKNEFNGGGTYLRPDPGKYFRQVNICRLLQPAWNTDGLVFDHSVGSEVFLRFKNYWWMDTGASRNARRFDDLDTRGGPPIVKPSNRLAVLQHQHGHAEGMERLPSSRCQRAMKPADGSARVDPTLRLQPSDRLQASISTGYTFAQDVAQWIKNEDLDGDGVRRKHLRPPAEERGERDRPRHLRVQPRT